MSVEVLGAPLLAGTLVLLVAGRCAPPPVRAVRRPGGDRTPPASLAPADRWRPGRTASIGLAVGVLAPLVAVLGLVPAAAVVSAVAVAAGVRGRRRSRRRARAIEQALPDLVDLLRLAAGSGLPVVAALRAVAPRAPPVVAAPVADALVRLERGIALAEVLVDLETALGPASDPLVAALERSAVTGAPLRALLEPVAADGHERRRRHAQEAAHRLPVALLLPLAGCILPAAIVLAIVPVVAVALGDLAP